MIPVTTFAGRDVAVLGLGLSGLATARALGAGGANVFAWDYKEKAREEAAAAGLVLTDLATVDWARFAAVTSNVPFVAILQGRNRIIWRELGWLRPLIGAALFAVFFAAHQWLFGVRPY